MSIATQSSGSRSPSSAPNTGNIFTQPLENMPHRIVAWVRQLSTPTLLRVLLGSIWLCVLLFWFAAATGLGIYRSGLQHIGRETGPGVIQAQRIQAALTAMHANTALSYAACREQFGIALLEAAANITQGKEEHDLIFKLQREMGDDDQSVDSSAEDAATKKMHSVLLPTADSLSNLKISALNKAYARQGNAQALATLWVFLAGSLMVGMLIMAQSVLFRRTRRLINPGLGGATLLAAVFFLWLGTSFVTAAGNLRAAKEDDFDTLQTLTQARLTAYDMRTNEGRWLATPPYKRTGDNDKSAFNAKADATRYLLGATTSYNYYQVNPHLNALQQFERYLTAHAILVHQADNGLYDWASQNYAGSGPTVSSANASSTSFSTFNAFDATLGSEMESYESAFQSSVESGIQPLQNSDFFVSAFALVIAASAFVGISPRLKEYTF